MNDGRRARKPRVDRELLHVPDQLLRDLADAPVVREQDISAIVRIGKYPRREKPTPAELDALRCLSHGATVDEAATMLGKSFHTVRQQVQNAKVRLAAKTHAQAVATCLRNGWLT